MDKYCETDGVLKYFCSYWSSQSG